MANPGDIGEDQGRNEDALANVKSSDNEYSWLDNVVHGERGNIIGDIQLTEDNYWIWSSLMRIVLGARGLYQFVDGTTREPDAGSVFHGRWKALDCTVMLLILNAMPEHMVKAYMYANSARDLWKNIEQVYGQIDGFLLYRLHRDINNLRQGQMTVHEYFNEFKGLWNRLLYVKRKSVPDCTCGAAKPRSEWDNSSEVMQFLIGLNRRFDDIRSRIIAMEPLPSIEKAYNLVWNSERMDESRMNAQRRNANDNGRN